MEVNRNIPQAAVVAVVNRGDPRLTHLNVLKAFDFPQSAEGSYLGYHPADSQEAIAHVQTAITQWGCEYLVFPSTSFWWLEYYDELREQLERSHVPIWDSGHCRIFRLIRPAAEVRKRGGKRRVSRSKARSKESTR